MCSLEKRVVSILLLQLLQTGCTATFCCCCLICLFWLSELYCHLDVSIFQSMKIRISRENFFLQIMTTLVIETGRNKKKSKWANSWNGLLLVEKCTLESYFKNTHVSFISARPGPRSQWGSPFRKHLDFLLCMGLKKNYVMWVLCCDNARRNSCQLEVTCAFSHNIVSMQRLWMKHSAMETHIKLTLHPNLQSLYLIMY